MTSLRYAVLFAALHAGVGVLTAGYIQQNLVSDLPGVAAHTDPNLVNPWGIAFSATSPFWISDNGTGKSTLYNGAGVPQSLVVTVPGPGGADGAPTGVVFNSGSLFNSDRFIFATEGGTIDGWKAGTSAVIEKDNSGAGAIYKGLTLGTSAAGPTLYAADFHSGAIEMFDGSYNPIFVAGAFVDPVLPSGYAPFNVIDLGGQIYVTYALQDANAEDDVPGAGHGFIDVFSQDGAFLRRLVSGGNLNSPWGVALAPSSFGQFGGALLVGNFGDGKINAYDPGTGAFEGALRDNFGNQIVNPGLWGLAFGNGAQGTSTSTLYFTAGIPGPDAIEDHGLFGALVNAPEPRAAATLGAGLLLLMWRGARRKRSFVG